MKETTTIPAKEAVEQFYIQSEIISSISENPQIQNNYLESLVLLTQGPPVLSALAVKYHRLIGIPELLKLDSQFNLNNLLEMLPYGNESQWTKQGETVRDSFISSMLAPYKERTLTHEAIIRMAIIQKNDRRLDNLNDLRLLLDEIPDDEINQVGLGEVWNSLQQEPGIITDITDDSLKIDPWLASELMGRYVPKMDKLGEFQKHLLKLFPTLT